MEVFAPTLTGLAERAGEATPSTDLSAHVADVVGVIDGNDLRDVVLLGHSYGGMVVTGAAPARLDRVSEIVYLDAFVPGTASRWATSWVLTSWPRPRPWPRVRGRLT
jgi:pimeloyl-ACP methyl ester carboxylesterase